MAQLFFAKTFGGSYGDLIIWGIVSFLLGMFYLLSSVRTVKGYIVVIVLAGLFFSIFMMF